jgi:hypothetical protein
MNIRYVNDTKILGIIHANNINKMVALNWEAIVNNGPIKITAKEMCLTEMCAPETGRHTHLHVIELRYRAGIIGADINRSSTTRNKHRSMV